MMTENELEIAINEAYENRDDSRIIELFESNKNVISKKYHPLNLKYIEAMYNQGNINGAIDLLQEELDMPYIPMEYEDAYKDLYMLCFNTLKSKNFERIASFTDEEIISEVFEKESNLSLVILSYLEDKNIRKFLPVIREYLKNENKVNYIKVFLFDVLKKQEVNEDLEVRSKSGVRVINPCNHHYFDEQIVLNEMFARLNDCIKDVVIIDIIKELSIGLCINLFPYEFKLEDIESIIGACHYTASAMIGHNLSLDELKSMYNVIDDRFYLFLDLLRSESKDISC